MSNASLFIRCDCHSPDHMFVFDVWHWGDHSELIAHYHLDECLPWWKRLWFAAQFVLTGKTQKWWWADTVINKADAGKLLAFLADYLALAAATGTAKTPQAVECEASQSGPKGNAQRHPKPGKGWSEQ